MPKKLPNTAGIYFERELLCSDAYWNLTGTEIRILNIFHMKCRKVGKSEAKKTHVPLGTIKNNGQIVFTYKEAGIYGISKAKFTRAIDKLIEIGFLVIAINGRQGVSTKYSISDRWKKYGTPYFIEKKRAKRSNYKPMRGTRFYKINNSQK